MSICYRDLCGAREVARSWKLDLLEDWGDCRDNLHRLRYFQGVVRDATAKERRRMNNDAKRYIKTVFGITVPP